MGREHEVERAMQLVIRQIWSCLLYRLNRLSQQQHLSPMAIDPFP
ncbi:hypothetical protein Syncc8109_0546 [Synechococcus sp. WH 8109]|nr:hypothetical protein Syncc8109_0546 [Synechococcus sp. WH 8109]